MDATYEKDENPPTRRLADRLRNAAWAARVATTIPRRATTGPAPLTFSQEALWLVERALPGTALYNIAWAYRLRGELDADALRQSLEAVVLRHDGLRTRFVEGGSSPVQEALPPSEVALDFGEIDLTDTPKEAREGTALARAREMCARPFDLARPPLLRGLLCRLSRHDHVWALSLHHIVGDGTSQAVIMRDLSACYLGFIEERPAAFPEIPLDLADLAVWQREQHARDGADDDLAWWVEQLADAPTVLDLPCDRPRGASPSPLGATLERRLPEALATSLRSLAQASGTTLYVVLLSALAALIHRWSGALDIVIGSPLSERDYVETLDMVGCLIDMMPLRIDCSGRPTFRALVNRVSETTRGARGHQGVPFARIVEALRPERSAGHHAVFQVVFCTRGEAPSFDAPGIACEPLLMDTGTAKFDLTLEVADTAGDLTVTLEHRADLFDEETVSRLWERFTRLVTHVSADPDQPIDAIDLLAEDEERAMLVGLNPHGETAGTVACLHQLIERQAADTPSATAVSCGEERLSYHALNARAERIAGQLRHLGVGGGTCVAFSLQRSVDQVAVMLGVLKAGGAYVYLDPDYPSERLAFMRDDCGAPLTITETAYLERIPWTCAVLLDEEGLLSSPLLADSGAPSPIRATAGLAGSAHAWEEPSADTLAYVTYTSGSTGRPKGVATPHRAVVSFLAAMQDQGWLSASDVLAAVSALSFDFHIIETWLPLVTGAELVLASRDVAADGRALRALVEERGVTAMGATPATFRLLLEAGWTGRPGFKIHVGGEALPPDLVAPLLHRAGSVHNVYGPTETTVYAATHPVGNGEHPVPIGRPLRNTRVYVVDGHDRLVPPGVWGELLIGGDGVALGYLNQPRLTAERFIDNPFAARERALGLTPPPRLYRSGDVVRRRHDGILEIRGRVDHQVKIRGYRIELGEIEAVMCAHPAVRQAVVTVDGQGQADRLVGYLVSDDRGLDLDDVRTHLAGLLPSHMCPSALVAMEALPLTMTGKLDRRALPAPPTDAFRHSRSPSEPRTPTEARLVALWADVLGLPQVGIHDSFFQLGGHSMMAARLFIRLRDEMGHDLPLSTLFAAPTPAEMARVLSQASATVRSILVPIQPEGHRPPFFWLHTLGGGGGGGLLRYRDLARRLGPTQPSYGLEAPREPFDTLEEMAAAYIEVMREVQPRGPYHLGGFCFGGVVAYEMASQLWRAGEAVGLVALIDSHIPALLRPPSALARLRRFLTKPLHDSVTSLGRMIRRPARLWQHAGEHTVPLEDVVDVSAYPQDFVHYARVHWHALQRYRPSRSGGRVDLFAMPEAFDELRTEWHALCGDDVRVYQTEGTHDTVLDEPHVGHLAQQLAPLLEERQRERAAGAKARQEEAAR